MSGSGVLKDSEDNHGREVSKSQVRNICEVVGSIASVKEARWTYEIPCFGKEAGIVPIGVDGTCMLTCEEGCRQAMVGTILILGVTQYV